jgi:hypothetical protein
MNTSDWFTPAMPRTHVWIVQQLTPRGWVSTIMRLTRRGARSSAMSLRKGQPGTKWRVRRYEEVSS